MDTIARNLKNTLANASLFKMLDEKQLDEIVSNTSPMRLAQNMYVVNQGDLPDGTFWVAYGQVKICMYSKQGGEKTLAILGADKCFGLGEMLLGQPHLAYVKTTADSMVLHTARDAMLHIAQENFDFSRNLMTCMGRQFYGLVRDIGAYAQTSRQRLATYLLTQSERESSADIKLVANKTLIASRLSLAPETLSRLFHDFAEEGLIKIAGRQIKLLDIDRLSTIVA